RIPSSPRRYPSFVRDLACSSASCKDTNSLQTVLPPTVVNRIRLASGRGELKPRFLFVILLLRGGQRRDKIPSSLAQSAKTLRPDQLTTDRPFLFYTN